MTARRSQFAGAPASRRAAAALAAALLLATIGACGRKGGSDDDAEGGGDPAGNALVPVRLAVIQPRDFQDTAESPGTWTSAAEVVVTAPFAARVQELNVRVGDRVARGQRVALLTTAESEATLEGAELMAREASDSSGRDEARRALAQARRELVRVPLAAPEAGFVLRRSAEPGTRVESAAEVVALVPWSDLVFEAHVPSVLGPRVRAGQPARVVEEGRPPRAARVLRVLPAADSTDQATIAWLAPLGPTAPPQLGHFGTATIDLGSARRMPAVPDSAVVVDDLTGVTRIAVVDSSRAHWVPVQLGAAAAGLREIRSPAIAPGTHVVVVGQRGLPEHARVQPQP